MPHRNAPLSETGRRRLARCVAKAGRPVRRAAEAVPGAVARRASMAAVASATDCPASPGRSPRKSRFLPGGSVFRRNAC